MSFVKAVQDEVRLARALLRKRILLSSKTEKDIVRGFHTLYYDSHMLGQSFFNTSWLGIPTLKCPMDLWVYQEILHELKPDLIIETGTAKGGSALFLASIFDLIGKGEVVTIDIEQNNLRPRHQRIQYLVGSSTSDEIVSAVAKMAAGKQTVLVILDSDHRQAHVSRELTIYSPFVTRGSYLIVEDTNVNGHPVDLEHGPGPMEAVDQFLATTSDFMIDREKEKFLMTFNPRGYLRRAK